MFPDHLVVLTDPRGDSGTGPGIPVSGVSPELSGILVSVSGISRSGVVHIGPGVGVVGVTAADVDVGGHLVDAGLEEQRCQFIDNDQIQWPA